MKTEDGFAPAVSLIVVLATLLTTLGGYAVYKNNQSKVLPPSVELTEKPSTPAGYQLYTDKVTGYTLLFPDSWSVGGLETNTKFNSRTLELVERALVGISDASFASFNIPQGRCIEGLIKCGKFTGLAAGTLHVSVIYSTPKKVDELIKNLSTTTQILKTNDGMAVYNLGKENDFGYEKSIVVIKPNFFIIFYPEIYAKDLTQYSKDPAKYKEAKAFYGPIIQRIIDSLDVSNFRFTLPPLSEVASTTRSTGSTLKPGWVTLSASDTTFEISYPNEWGATNFVNTKEFTGEVSGFVPIVDVYMSNNQSVKKGESIDFSVSYYSDAKLKEALVKNEELKNLLQTQIDLYESYFKRPAVPLLGGNCTKYPSNGVDRQIRCDVVYNAHKWEMSINQNPEGGTASIYSRTKDGDNLVKVSLDYAYDSSRSEIRAGYEQKINGLLNNMSEVLKSVKF